ncbi:hypothetical protein SBBP2_1480016 [Burkholderiales bacterium]|nr:hypothetical protein SBBP2_1480016 [Burkholderiales bacterium]
MRHGRRWGQALQSGALQRPAVIDPLRIPEPYRRVIGQACKIPDPVNPPQVSEHKLMSLGLCAMVQGFASSIWVRNPQAGQ